MIDSPLSEAGVLGFEFGYSTDMPEALVIWEAQFGDFANGAQVIIDQFIASSEDKWSRLSGLVLMLPHGFEGQGPEHSSARLERFLGLCAEHNMQVCNLTTPAQLFHCLRRHVMRPLRKPLVIMSPKSLLRHPAVVSTLAELSNDHFKRMIIDPRMPDPKKVERVIFCSGKVYYDLVHYRKEQGIKNTAILRVEQLYPLHEKRLKELFEQYKGFKHFVWCQEEPQNMGAWSFIAPELETISGMKPAYAGRKAAASPAVGALSVHKIEQAALIERAFNL